MNMDGPTTSIVEFARSAKFASLSEKCVHAVTRNYFDSVAAAAAGFDVEPAQIARRLASTTSGSPAASAFGLPNPALVEYVAFANAMSTRYADYNDGGLSAGHPSDISSALMAMAEASRASGADLVLANYVGYEVIAAMGAVIPLRNKKWDQTLFHLVATTAGMGSLLHLTDEQLANAIALAITPSIALRVTRAGEISHWKAGAAAHATMTATFASRMAQAGMTGPRRVFDGIEGLFEKVTGPFDLGKIGTPEGKPTVPERVQHKYYPTIIEGQGPVQMMLKLAKNFKVSEVETITLTTEHVGWHEGGGGQGDVAEKWDPKTRETADHSLPYVLARALVDGDFGPDSYTPERLADPAIRPLMQKMSVLLSDEYTKRKASHGELISVLDIKLKDGRTISDKIIFPRGHKGNPMTDQEVDEKFERTIRRVLPPAERAELSKRLWDLPNQKDLSGIAGLYRKWSPQKGS